MAQKSWPRGAPARAARFSWSQSEIGLSLGFAGVMMMLGQAFLIRWVIDSYGSRATIYLGLAGAFIAYGGYALVTQGWMVYIFLMIGATQGFIGPAVQGLMSGSNRIQVQLGSSL